MKGYINIPNILSASRLLMFPVLLYAAFAGNKDLFAWLFLASLVTDFLDGVIARTFNMVTEFGSKLDSWGDLCNYIAALVGIITLYWSDVTAHAYGFSILFGLYFLGFVIMLLKFKKLIGLHLYSAKATGYVHGIFLLVWFLFGFNEIIYQFAFVFGAWAFSEEIVLILLLRKPDHDLKSLFWVILKRKELWKKV